MAVDFAKNLRDAEDAGLVGGGDYFKVKEGDNKFRLMTECIPHASEFKGQKNFKWLCYVVDRRDGKVKPYFMPHSIYKQIAALQQSDDYSFFEVPMPYDLTLNARGAGTKEVVYTLLPARKETPVTALEHQELAKQKSLKELHEKLKEKQKSSAPADDERSPHDGDEEERERYPFE